MRLTLVTETFPPEVNGVARTLGRWVDAFRRRGHWVQVIRPRQPHERGSQERVFALPLPFYREVRLGLAAPGRLRRLLAESRPDLVHVATEGPLGLAALLEAFVGLRGPRVRLALVGGGPSAEWLRGACPPDVVMPGYQHGEALARWYASADVFAFPSLTETFGNVILEAQACGLPVVGFRCPALAERVADGEDGLLVEDCGGMAGALARLVADSGLRHRFGAAARVKAEGQDWEPIFDRLEARYGDVIARTEPGTGAVSRRLARLRRGEPACVPTAD